MLEVSGVTPVERRVVRQFGSCLHLGLPIAETGQVVEPLDHDADDLGRVVRLPVSADQRLEALLLRGRRQQFCRDGQVGGARQRNDPVREVREVPNPALP